MKADIFESERVYGDVTELLAVTLFYLIAPRRIKDAVCGLWLILFLLGMIYPSTILSPPEAYVVLFIVGVAIEDLRVESLERGDRAAPENVVYFMLTDLIIIDCGYRTCLEVYGVYSPKLEELNCF